MPKKLENYLFALKGEGNVIDLTRAIFDEERAFVSMTLTNKEGEEYHKSAIGKVVTKKEGVELLKAVVAPAWKKDLLAKVTKTPKNYEFSVVRVRGNSDRNTDGKAWFTQLYVAEAA